MLGRGSPPGERLGSSAAREGLLCPRPRGLTAPSVLPYFWWVVLDSKHRGTQLGRMYLHLLSDNKEPCSLKLKAKCLHYGTRFVS